jgi:hypothetical protein
MNHTTEEAEARPREVRHERLAAAEAEFSSHIQTELLPEKTDFSKVAQDDPPDNSSCGKDVICMACDQNSQRPRNNRLLLLWF